jgi:hypothetical protein
VASVNARLSFHLQLDSKAPHIGEDPHRRDDAGEPISKLLLEPVAHSYKRDVRSDRAGIQKYSLACVADVDRCYFRPERDRRSFGEIERNPMILGEVVERSTGKYRELDVRSGNRLGRGADRSVTACNQDPLRTRQRRLLLFPLPALRRRLPGYQNGPKTRARPGPSRNFLIPG